MRRALPVALGIVAAIVTACGGAGTAGGPVPLVLISFDGFRWDYADRSATPALDRLAASGVRAERLIPVFPSKTFPGHYSIVTGLYTGHHGIISNNMRDPQSGDVFGTGSNPAVQDARWWAGEPIWVTAGRAGLGTGVYFWPGSEAPIDGRRPDRWFPYDEAAPWDTRVDAALDWLTAAGEDRASFVALYFEEPNEAGHAYGPDAPETADAVARADAVLARVLDGLAARGVDANVMVVSDHGMAANDASRVIVLDDFVELAADEVFEQGAIGQIFPRPGREGDVFAALEGAHPHLSVYRRGAAPARLHLFDHPRLPPILLAPDAGWEVVTREQFEKSGGRPIAGDHGQDPANPDLHGIFYAAGPGLAPGVRLGAVEQVDLYALMCRLLGIEPAPNDGDWSRVAPSVREH